MVRTGRGSTAFDYTIISLTSVGNQLSYCAEIAVRCAHRDLATPLSQSGVDSRSTRSSLSEKTTISLRQETAAKTTAPNLL